MPASTVSGPLSQTLRIARILPVIFLLGWTSLSAAEPLEVTLTQHVVKEEGGTTKHMPADSVSPGDVVEYKATYANTTDGELGGVAATVPVPPGMVYLPGSAMPAPSEFSEDGSTFMSISELQRADGSFRPIRALRWPAQDIPAGGSMTVVLRAQVNPTE